MGIFGGLLGSFFCTVNYFLGKQRKRFLTTKFRKVMECVTLVMITSTIFFFLPQATK
jgi:H+/Cl- antiporter ClcA